MAKAKEKPLSNTAMKMLLQLTDEPKLFNGHGVNAGFKLMDRGFADSQMVVAEHDYVRGRVTMRPAFKITAAGKAFIRSLAKK